MKIPFLILCLVLGVASQAAAQTEAVSISTSTLDSGARFEIIQSPHERTITFRLDRFTGTIHRLGNCPKDDGVSSSKCWKEMVVIDQPKSPFISKPRYQIVIDGPQRLIMLMQIETGQTWQTGLEPTDKWYPFIECLNRTDLNCFWRP